jgi:hypothetical protein
MVCHRQFQNHSQKERIEKVVWKEYIYRRQTIHQLSERHNRGKDWIRERIRNASVKNRHLIPQPVVVIADVTFFGRSSGICVIRAPHLKKNIYMQEVHSESTEIYRQGRIALEKQGYTLQAIVLDGRPGVRQIFSDIPVQMCHFHQKQIVTRYLTRNPKLQASRELKILTKDLCVTNEESFIASLDAWYSQWSSFLKERTADSITGKWHYTHKRLRSAYRSLRLNLPYLFIYQKYPEMNIPNTTNSLDGCFAYLKELLRVHRGSTRSLKNKIIKEVLGR